MMKKLLGLLIIVSAFSVNAQSNTDLLKHYQDYYNEMKSIGDVQGVIGALTHLNILEPSQAKKDTLAALYMNDGRYLQALNIIGIENNATDSNFAIEVKAVCLQELNQPERALVQFKELFKRNPNPLVAYELAELNIQLNNLDDAAQNITYGIENSRDDILRTFTESQIVYRVPIKAAFLYLRSLMNFKRNPETNLDSSVAILDEALKIAPDFNLARMSKDALLSQKGK